MEEKKETKKILGHIPYIIAIIAIAILFYMRPFSLTQFPGRDPALAYIPAIETVKKSIEVYNDPFPLWDPHRFGGTPYYGKGNYLGIDSAFIGPLMFLTGSSVKTTRLSYLLDMIFAGIFMYLLLTSLELRKRYAFIGSLIYLFNGYAIYIYLHGWLTSTNAYLFSPLVLLFVIKAFKGKEWIKYSVISGIMLMLQFRAGPDLKVSIWIFLMLILYGIIYIIGKDFTKKAIKAVLIGIITSLIFLGLSAERIFTTKEYIKISSRGDVSWEEASGRKISLKDLFTTIIEPLYKGMPKIQRDVPKGYHVGLIAFFLGCFAIYKKRKNKFILFLALSALLSLSISTGSFVFYFLWKYIPPFNSTRYVTRALSLFVFAWSILAAFGASYLINSVKEKFKFNQKKEIILYTLLVIIIILNLTIFNYTIKHPHYSNVDEVIKNNYLLQNISEERKSHIFRIHTYETNGIDWGTDLWNVPLGLEHIYAYEAAWYPPYFNEYLAIAYGDRAKFYGILNVKYMTARNEVNITNFKLIKKFKECTVCFPEEENIQKAWGPYLYENELFLPRAYIVNNSILVLGEKDSVTRTIYFLMINENFKPYNTVIIRGKKSINDYEIGDLRKYSAILLTKDSINQNSIFKLQQYVNSGGILLPDVTKNENSLSEDDINKLLGSFKGDLNQIEDKNIIMHNFDKYEIKLDGEKGFLVYSEKFSIFSGWIVKDQNKRQLHLLNANSMISAIYLEGNEKSLLFEYKPRSFSIGSIITIITLLVITGYFLWKNIRKGVKHEEAA